MSTKQVVIALSISFLAGGAFGRFTVPEKVKIEKEVVTVEKKTEDTKKTTKIDTDRDKHRETTVIEVVRPDGTKETTTKTVEDTKTERKTDSNTDTKITENKEQTLKETKEVVRGSTPVTISMLVGTSLQFSGGINSGPIVYGASISRSLLGPVAVGVWGLNNSTFGFSLGLIF